MALATPVAPLALAGAAWAAVVVVAPRKTTIGHDNTPSNGFRAPESPETLTDALDGGRQVRPQPHRVIVARVERHPNDGLRALDAPQPQERRLAVPDRRVEDRERGPGVAIEHLKQA